MTLLTTAFRWLCAFGTGLSMGVLFVSVFANALSRYTLGQSARWSEELPIYLTIYGVMFGAALAYSQDRHIRFTLLTDLIPERRRTQLFAAVDLVTAVLGGLLVWSAVLFVASRGGVQASGLIAGARSLAEATGLDWLVWLGRMGSWQSAMVLGGVLVGVAGLLRFAERVGELRAAR